ncbi:pseudouridine synthase [Microstroma glucosiphilum]|uniref:Pseudouridine synthase n=1 Tax=Pseudomicrostroma glucosiphilum TaxID=1684307 RepID=A0A316UAZ9_9BASI|nr:pseudouridine synthase [Pseudomicrostroma glucosiphilum]PWN22028.1 pseudouridine synthase [Pseudomicrostroma glucosiphilum]
MSSSSSSSSAAAGPSRPSRDDVLRREPAYWHTFTTNAKMRWYNRRILDVLVEEFRDRTKHYYTWAIHKGLLKINGEKVLPGYIVRNGDVITHTAHKHEPPITSDPVRILYQNDEQGRVVVVKPGSVPVHPAGRYLRHTLLELIKSDHGIEKVFTANRLDRLTSGIMVASTTTAAAKELAADFESGRVRKAYICRVKGCFPEAETVCEEPLLSLDRQTGVVIVHPLGRVAKTIFNRLSYDSETDTSVLFCRPITGRTHQIRVHAQLLGHVIPNDPIYAHPIWQEYPAGSLKDIPVPSTSEVAGNHNTNNAQQVAAHAYASAIKYLASTRECASIIEALKNSKDEGEDWSRLKDEVRFAEWNQENGWKEGNSVSGVNAAPAQGFVSSTADDNEGGYCEECFLPLLPDPPAEALFIYLHAIRYETDDWSFEDEMPWWAREGWRSPDALKKAQEARERGEVIRPPRLKLVSEMEALGSQVDQVCHEGQAATEVSHDGVESEIARHSRDEIAALSNGTSAIDLAPADVWPPPTFAPLLKRAPLPGIVGASSPFSEALDGVSLVLETFRGLEDFTLRDLQTRLRGTMTSFTPPIKTAVHTGHLIVPQELAQAVWQLPDLPFVSGKYVLIASETIPEDSLNQLLEDRQTLGTRKQSRVNQKAKARAKKGAVAAASDKAATEEARTTEPVERTPDGQVASEARLLAFLQKVWTESAAKIDAALQVWRKHAIASGSLSKDNERWTFRATVERSVYKLPTLVSSDICRHVGEHVWATLNGALTVDDHPPHPVSLKECDLDVVCSFAPWLNAEKMGPVMREGEEKSTYGKAWNSNPPGSVLFMIKLPDGPLTQQMSHRPSVAETKEESGSEGSTALARYRAYTLASLLPLPVSPTAGVAQQLKIWEPCVGTGAIAIELCALLRERGLRATIFGSDVEEENIAAARRVSRASGWKQGLARDGIEVRYEHLDLKDEAGAAHFLELPAIEKSTGGAGLLDGIVVDLPWGRRELSHGVLASLYAHFLQACLRTLKPYHCAIAVTLEHKTLQRALIEVEGVIRRRGHHRWMMKLERLVLNEGEGEGEGEGERSEVNAQGSKQADEMGGARVVEMGLRPAVYLLRKVPL